MKKISDLILIGSILSILLLLGCNKNDDNLTPQDNNGDNTDTTDNTLIIEPGTFTDSRDNKTYNTITIGEQTWFAENLAYTPDAGNYQITLYDTLNDIKSHEYDWVTAFTVAPEGWHLPSKDEYVILLEYLQDHDMGTDEGVYAYVSKAMIKDANRWKESATSGAPGCLGYESLLNKSGFSAIPNEYGGATWFWTSSEFSPIPENAYLLDINYDRAYVRIFTYEKESKNPIRCIKD